jgi:hypothetical protein
VSPQEAQHWYDAIMPALVRGGPVLTLGLLIMMAVSTWWLTSWMHDCVERNRQLTERMLTQQQAFYAEVRVALAHCQREPER